MVPIVLGAYKEDYISTLPPQSYINVDDFRSMRDLADYVKYLDRNDTAYAAYFAWRQFGEFAVRFQTIFKIHPCNFDKTEELFFFFRREFIGLIVGYAVLLTNCEMVKRGW